MKLRLLPLLSVLAFTLTLACRANDSEAIESKLKQSLSKLEKGPEAREKAEALFKATVTEIDAYLKEKPDAKEQLKAQVLQVQLYNVLGEKEKVNTLIPELYKKIPKGKDGDFKSAIPLVALKVISDINEGDKKSAEAMLKAFETDFAEHTEMSTDGKEMVASMRGRMSVPTVGDKMEIAFTALDGSKVDLAAMKDKVVLVDFWATWCGPCVGEMPNVKQAYTTYHPKGFEIIGISLDQEEDALRSFIKKNDMPWVQAFDGKGWQSAIATKYGIHSIPATFLIGKDGKIAATNLRGPALEEKLAELLK